MQREPAPAREVVPDVSPDLPPLHWRGVIALLERLPQAALSSAAGRIADTPIPRSLRRAVIGAFARTVRMDVDEAELPLEHYPSINAFFVRRLKPGVRRWPHDDDTIASPVDGIVGRHGRITSGRLIQAKGRDYSAAALLDEPDAQRFEGGSFLTIYLSPRHYHRIHAPCSGVIPSARHVPGALLPVNAAGVQHIADLFPRSERIVCDIDAAMGRVAVVAVGAYNVGRISTAFDDEWAGAGMSVANRRGAQPASRRYQPPRAVRQGDEIMAFHLGSTVVLLVEPGARLVAPAPGTEVRMGAVMLRR